MTPDKSPSAPAPIVEGRESHTPGPWMIERKKTRTDGINIWSGDGPAYLGTTWHIAEVQGSAGDLDDSEEESEANARLIAAAPDLLEMLKYLRNYARLIDISDETIGNVDAVIAKASSPISRSTPNHGESGEGEKS